jgi:hypothetical protein
VAMLVRQAALHMETQLKMVLLQLQVLDAIMTADVWESTAGRAGTGTSEGVSFVVHAINYSAPTSCTQKLKLMKEGGHFTYSSTLLMCSSRMAQMWNRSRLQFILINRVH